MGFSGGGANVTKSHTHDSSVVQDGGSLAANATQFGLTNGSLLYSDGTNIQELGVGASSEVLGTASGTIPTWETAAAGGGNVIFVDSVAATTTVSGIEKTFTSIAQADISELIVVFSGEVNSAVNLELTVNGENGTDYDADGLFTFGGTSGVNNWSAQVGYEHSRAEIGSDRFSVIHLYSNAANERVIFNSHSGGEFGTDINSGWLDVAITAFTEIRVQVRSAGVNMLADSKLDIYKVTVA